MADSGYRQTISLPGPAVVLVDAVPGCVQRQPVQDRRVDARGARRGRIGLGRRVVARGRGLHPAVPAVFRICGSGRRRLQQAFRPDRHQIARDRRDRPWPDRIPVRPPGAHLHRPVSDRASGHLLQSREVRNSARDSSRQRAVARERRARDEHLRRHRCRHGARRLDVRRLARPPLAHRGRGRRRGGRRDGREFRHSERHRASSRSED